MSLGAILFVVFLVMKLAGIGAVAAWSWWLVFLPLIIEAVLDLIIFILFGNIVLNAFNGRRSRR